MNQKHLDMIDENSVCAQPRHRLWESFIMLTMKLTEAQIDHSEKVKSLLEAHTTLREGILDILGRKVDEKDPNNFI